MARLMPQASSSLFAPLSSSFLGFDKFFAELERMLDISSSNTIQSRYPPMNLYKEANGDYTIEVAAAGFKREHIKIQHDERTGLLSIFGSSGLKSGSLNDPDVKQWEPAANGDIEQVPPRVKQTPETRVVINHGIATRQFSRHFTLADDMKVKNARLEDGMLVIVLSREKPPEVEYIPRLVQLD